MNQRKDLNNNIENSILKTQELRTQKSMILLISRKMIHDEI